MEGTWFGVAAAAAAVGTSLVFLLLLLNGILHKAKQQGVGLRCITGHDRSQRVVAVRTVITDKPIKPLTSAARGCDELTSRCHNCPVDIPYYALLDHRRL